MDANESLLAIKGIGPNVAEKFKRLGVYNLADLLEYFPRTYVDYSKVETISAIKPGFVTIQGTIKQAKGRYVRGGLHITEAILSDATDSVRLVWFNQPYRAASLKADADYYVSGKFELRSSRFAITNPQIELATNFPINTARILPIYRETKGIKSPQIRKVLREALKNSLISETLPEGLIKKHHLIPKHQAIYLKHFPVSMKDVTLADRRLGFEELFEIILASSYAKQELNVIKAPKISFNEKLIKQFVEKLPFKLTNAQRKCIWQIYQDLQQEHPMNRLIEGDVGAGKTVVATMAALAAVLEGYQVAFMAPTELLARQHAETIHKLLESLGMSDVVVLLVGGMKKSDKERAYDAIKHGQAKLLVGTHALIQDKVDVSALGLVIVDEQHRFGVEQRKKLLAKSGLAPHMLSMTATPIPRSLALTVFGELDISVLDEKPLSRKPIITQLIKPSDADRLLIKIKQELGTGNQMFVVCPLIEESDQFNANSAEKTFAVLKQKLVKFKVGLLHGKMKPADKQEIMQKFVDRQIDVLVSTTVIEVGVDVPNANLMMIEGPERFGLAQLHQLRGRVGRSERQGYCYLMLSDSSEPSRRLKAIETTQDGFKLAELDLELRGAGALYGTSQHGQLDLRIAKFTDTYLVAEARAAAKEFMSQTDNLLQYPYIKQRITELQSVVHLN